MITASVCLSVCHWVHIINQLCRETSDTVQCRLWTLMLRHTECNCVATFWIQMRFYSFNNCSQSVTISARLLFSPLLSSHWLMLLIILQIIALQEIFKILRIRDASFILNSVYELRDTSSALSQWTFLKLPLFIYYSFVQFRVTFFLTAVRIKATFPKLSCCGNLLGLKNFVLFPHQ